MDEFHIQCVTTPSLCRVGYSCCVWATSMNDWAWAWNPMTRWLDEFQIEVLYCLPYYIMIMIYILMVFFCISISLQNDIISICRNNSLCSLVSTIHYLKWCVCVCDCICVLNRKWRETRWCQLIVKWFIIKQLIYMLLHVERISKKTFWKNYFRLYTKKKKFFSWKIIKQQQKN